MPEALHEKDREKTIGGFVVISLLISIQSFSTYWSWVQIPAFALAQRPVVTVEEFPTYLSLIRERIEEERPVFLLHQWNDPSWREEHLPPSY